MTSSSSPSPMHSVHDPLREDVGYLGSLLGRTLRDQGGASLYTAVEAARTAAIERRGAGAPPDRLQESLAGLPVDVAAELVRAFSVYFSLTNLAEQVHRIRRRRDYQLSGKPQPGSLDAVLGAAPNRDPGDLQAALESLRVVPVFTAHPTEATRRTLLRKEQRVARALVDRIEQTRRTPLEERRIEERILSEIGLIWQTSEQSPLRPSVADEVEHVLFFLTEVIYRVVPAFQEALKESAEKAGLQGNALPCPVVRFGSWVGGDMDGNPNVGAETLLATLLRQRELILERYRGEVRTLFEHLSQSAGRVDSAPEVGARCSEYRTRFSRAASDIPSRYEDMPYRVLLWMMWYRLGETADEGADAYGDPEEFIEDLLLIRRSLGLNQGDHAGGGLVDRLLVRVRTFGFHLATLDLRQDAAVHREAVAHLLGDPGFADLPAGGRTQALAEAVARPQSATGSEPVDAVLEVFRATSAARLRFGPRAVGPYIISMAQGVDDVLAVLYLARSAGLVSEGAVPLDVVPLFETVDDLEGAAATLTTMLSHADYREHLATRDHRQTVMLGYSDSAKVSGVGASRWALFRAQEAMLTVAAEAGIHLDFFHGRGGTVARGGSKPRQAILAEPAGAVPGSIRTTEQGEIINGKFGLRGIAERSLELATGAVLEAAARPVGEGRVEASWRAVMDMVASASRDAWNHLLHQDPRFLRYFRSATPIDVIERLPMGSRPASRRGGGGVESLRAIPWVFAWTQNRHTVPAWYGLGNGLAAAEARFGLDRLQEMSRDWPFFENLLADASMAMAKADLGIGAVYAELADEESRTLFPDIARAFAATRDVILRIRAEDDLLDREPLLRETIRLRNPYVDPMSLLQVDLLRRWREGGRTDAAMERVLFDTVRGIARGLRNTG